MEEQRKKTIKIDMAFEIGNQMFINILLVLLSISETRTETAFESLFNQEGEVETFGISNLTIFIASTVASFFSFLNLFTSAHASNWPFKSKLAVGVYGTMNLAMRLLAMILYFTPSLGLLNILRHYQSDRFPFFNFNGKYDFSRDYLYFGIAPPVAWSDVTHVNYTGLHISWERFYFRVGITFVRNLCSVATKYSRVLILSSQLSIRTLEYLVATTLVKPFHTHMLC